DGVGTHIGDQAVRAVVAQVDTLIKLLRDRHRLLRREAELSRGLLLHARGDKRRCWLSRALFLLDGADFPVRVLEAIEKRIDRCSVRKLRVLTVRLKERSIEVDAVLGERAADRPILLGLERFNFLLAVNNESESDGLHATRGKPALHFVPKERRDL